MNLIKRVLRLQYGIARLPLDVIESKLIAPRGPEDPARLAFERVVGTLDSAAGTIVGDKSLVDRGSSMRGASESRARAVLLEEEAARKRDEAAADHRERTEDAETRAKKARENAAKLLAAAEEQEIEDKLAAGKKAAEKMESDVSRIDDIADKRIDAAEAERQAKLDEVARSEDEASQPEVAEMNEAVEKVSDARKERADAERLDAATD